MKLLHSSIDVLFILTPFKIGFLISIFFVTLVTINLLSPSMDL